VLGSKDGDSKRRVKKSRACVVTMIRRSASSRTLVMAIKEVFNPEMIYVWSWELKPTCRVRMQGWVGDECIYKVGLEIANVPDEHK
jgi:hypothetical protein